MLIGFSNEEPLKVFNALPGAYCTDLEIEASECLTHTVGYETICWKKRSSGSERRMMAAPTEAKVLFQISTVLISLTN
jgi:hypothetical protein